MNWSSAKNVLIVVFFILNTVLGILIFNVLKDKNTPEDIINKFDSILLDRGVAINCSIPRVDRPIGILYTDNVINKIEIIEYFMKDVKYSETVLNNRDVFIKKGTGIKFTTNNSFIYKEKVDDINEYLNKKYCVSFLNNFLVKLDFKNSGVSTNQLNQVNGGFIYKEKHQGIDIEDNYFKFYKDKNDIFYFEASYKEVSKEFNIAKVMPFRVVAFKNFTKDNSINIESVKMVYKNYLYNSNSDTSTLVPVWEVTDDKNIVSIFNALDGEIFTKNY